MGETREIPASEIMCLSSSRDVAVANLSPSVDAVVIFPPGAAHVTVVLISILNSVHSKKTSPWRARLS